MKIKLAAVTVAVLALAGCNSQQPRPKGRGL